MGQTARKKPSRLGEKLLRVRTAFGLSQNGMIKKLGLGEELSQSNISGFERGVREPSLLVLLKYASGSFDMKMAIKPERLNYCSSIYCSVLEAQNNGYVVVK